MHKPHVQNFLLERAFLGRALMRLQFNKLNVSKGTR